MMSFSKDTDFARSTPTRIALYSVSLLDKGKPSRVAYSMLSLVGVLSCKPTPALLWQEAPSTLRIHQLALSGSISG